jgi:4-amino-4-deoxy-L-arabinose transferase-like glycosyltransferase
MKQTLREIFIKDYKTVIFLWILVWAVFHFFTLGISPMPWYDEVFYANIADSFSRTGKMFLGMSIYPDDTGREILRYGPVYFWIQSFMIKIFGLKPEVVRMLNLLSGISLVFLFEWVTRKLYLSRTASAMIILFITTDTIFQSNMHSGRMDLFAALLFFLALFLFMFKGKISLMPLYGLLFAASFLTTPRIGFYFLSLVFLFVYELLKNTGSRSRILIKYVILAISFSIPLMLWIQYKFGGMGGYMTYLQGDQLLNAHVGMNIVPNKYQLPIILVWLILFILVLFKRKPQLFDYLLFIIIICHWIFVKEVGPYSAMIMPAVYCSVLLSLHHLKPEGAMKKLTSAFLLFVLLLNTSIFLFKATLVIAGREARNPRTAAQQLMKYDLNGKMVLADYKYYYLVENFGGNFISFQFNEKILDEGILNNIDYVLINKNGLENLKKKFPDRVFNEIPIRSPEQSNAYNFVRRFGFNIESNYNGFLIESR